MDNQKTIFVTYAVKEEFIPLTANNYNVQHIHTGVGKTKSATSLTKNICLNKPELVLNIGTAGTHSHNIGDVFVATHFIDRDYEATQLPGLEYEIDGISLIQYPLPGQLGFTTRKTGNLQHRRHICNRRCSNICGYGRHGSLCIGLCLQRI